MEDTNMNWRKALYSSNGGGNCVEVADNDSRVLVRDTKDRTGPMLRFSPAAWRRFAGQVKRSLASDPQSRVGQRSDAPLPLAFTGASSCLEGAPFGVSGAVSSLADG